MRLYPADVEVVRYIARNMREWDRREIFALRSDDDPDALVDDMTPLLRRAHAWTAHTDAGEPAAVFGAYERWPRRWSVFMFGTDSVPAIGLPLTRHVMRNVTPALEGLGMLQADCYSLDGHVDAQNWLRVLGFVEQSRLPNYGRDGETFLRFVWQRGD